MELHLDDSTPFTLDHVLECGQVFRWFKDREWWYGIVDQTVIKIKQVNDTLHFQTYPEAKGKEFIRNYFRLDDDLLSIYSHLNKDPNMDAFIHKFYGLRLVRQQPWECCISYICATYKRVEAIKVMVSKLARKSNKKIDFDGHEFHIFPEPQVLAQADLSDCHLGYRVNYVVDTASLIRDGTFNLGSLEHLEYSQAKKKLMGLPGIGPKVADCILAFSLNKLDAFTIDVNVKNGLLKFYTPLINQEYPGLVPRLVCTNSLSDSEYSKLNTFARSYFGAYSSYAQQYLFHYMRTCTT